MTRLNITPRTDSLSRREAVSYRGDDIELPPSREHDHRMGSDGKLTTWSSVAESTERFEGAGKALAAIVIIGAIAIGSFLVLGRGSHEQQHENWQHVDAASKASSDASQQLVYVNSAGGSNHSEVLEVSSLDINHRSMHEIRMALLRNDLVSATAALQSAQILPNASSNPDVKLPTVDAGAAHAIKNGRKELYQIGLFDCCHEDGDIVEVLVNGVSYARVPISHRGTSLSILLDRGSNTVTVRGVKDGGGGVTLSFRTSRGEYFARYMSVGEEHQMEVVVR